MTFVPYTNMQKNSTHKTKLVITITYYTSAKHYSNYLPFNIANRILQIEAKTHQPQYRPKTKIDKPKVTSRPNYTSLPMCA